VAKTPQANHHTADWTAGRSIHNAINSFTSRHGARSIMVTWKSLSEQAEQLSWRDRLMLIWQLVRSLGRRSPQTQSSKTQSAWDAFQPFVGVGDGPEDLSTNPAYLEGYGEPCAKLSAYPDRDHQH
jgi:hypothetical protein